MKTFELLPEHITLLRAMSWQWSRMEHGAPECDPKRPFGNSDMEGDVAEVLGWELGKDRWGDPALSHEQQQRAEDLYGQTLTALRVVLDVGPVPGLYVQHTSDGSWWSHAAPNEEQP